MCIRDSSAFLQSRFFYRIAADSFVLSSLRVPAGSASNLLDMLLYALNKSKIILTTLAEITVLRQNY